MIRARNIVRAWAPAVAALVVVLVTTSLGQWQLRRAEEKETLASAHARALAVDPIDLTSATRAEAPPDGARARARGRFLPDDAVFLDNRTRQGVAGFFVLMPLRLEPADGAPRLVMVLRGWVARDVRDRTRLPDLATPAGAVEIEGIVERALQQPLVLGSDPEPAREQRIWQHFTVARFERWSGSPALPFVLRQSSALDDGLARDWQVPGSGADRHRAYAFQWFAMAVATAVFWLVATLRRRRAGASQRSA